MRGGGGLDGGACFGRILLDLIRLGTPAAGQDRPGRPMSGNSVNFLIKLNLSNRLAIRI